MEKFDTFKEKQKVGKNHFSNQIKEKLSAKIKKNEVCFVQWKKMKPIK